MFWVYILRSQKTGRLYVGHTENLPRRLQEHAEGRGGRHTRENGPWELRFSEQHPVRSGATARERYLKSRAGSQEKRRLGGLLNDQPAAWSGPKGKVAQFAPES